MLHLSCPKYNPPIHHSDPLMLSNAWSKFPLIDL